MGNNLPADPTDPASNQATIDHLRELLAERENNPESETLLPSERQASDTGRSGEETAVGKESGARLQENHELGSDSELLEKARGIALRQLTASARSTHQLREAMVSRDIPETVAQDVIDRFERVGLVDDAEYAAMLVRTRHAERGLARRGLTVELARKGIDEYTAQEALGQIDSRDEEEAALHIVRRRVRTMHNLDAVKRRNRLYGTLARKGYTSSMARQVIDQVLTEQGLDLY